MSIMCVLVAVSNLDFQSSEVFAQLSRMLVSVFFKGIYVYMCVCVCVCVYNFVDYVFWVLVIISSLYWITYLYIPKPSSCFSSCLLSFCVPKLDSSFLTGSATYHFFPANKSTSFHPSHPPPSRPLPLLVPPCLLHPFNLHFHAKASTLTTPKVVFFSSYMTKFSFFLSLS